MPIELISRRDLEFILYEMLGVERLTAWPRFAEHGRETFDAVLDTAARIADDHFRPHHRTADLAEPVMEHGTVRLPPEIGPALAALAGAGLLAAHHDQADGGSQLPWVVTQACHTHFCAANLASFAYAFLTIAAANLLKTYGDPDLKGRYLAPLLDGRMLGTMAMSEPQAGSSLGDIRTRAEPTAAGHYLISGHKMWISAGMHELSDNIVHLVLARMRGAPAGIKGLSLFLVPRRRPDGAGNDVVLAGLNHKMGYRGTVNTVLNFGESGDCRGWLVGPAGQGMACMFHMMNEARIVVGLSAAALACAGYRVSLDYARTRPQGRPAGEKDPASPPVAIIRHADVRRMLLAQKCAAEGSLALGLYLALLVDRKRAGPAGPPDQAESRRAGRLLDLLTPIMKAWGSEICLAANSQAIQVLGGYGYTRDYPVEQYWRDNRLNPIHEGTNGIQALDLLGRKVGMDDGAAFSALADEIGATIAAARPAGLAEFAAQLERALAALAATTSLLVAAQRDGRAEAALANAAAYLEMAGHVVLGWMWLWQAVVAAGAKGDNPFYRGKSQACRYFFRWELPKVHTLAEVLTALDPTCLEMEESWF